MGLRDAMVEKCSSLGIINKSHIIMSCDSDHLGLPGALIPAAR